MMLGEVRRWLVPSFTLAGCYICSCHVFVFVATRMYLRHRIVNASVRNSCNICRDLKYFRHVDCIDRWFLSGNLRDLSRPIVVCCLCLVAYVGCWAGGTKLLFPTG